MGLQVNFAVHCCCRPVVLLAVVVGCRFGSAVYIGLDQRSYSTLGPVSAWVDDRLWIGNHLGAEPGTQVYSA